MYDVNGVEDFLRDMLPRQIEAETALCNGDAEPRLRLWSRNDPVTLLGAFGVQRSGWEEVSETSRWVASRFSNCEAYDFDLFAAGASGDLAYTVGFEKVTASTDGGPIASFVVRVTHGYRREDGQWKIVHRHGDYLDINQRPRS